MDYQLVPNYGDWDYSDASILSWWPSKICVINSVISFEQELSKMWMITGTCGILPVNSEYYGTFWHILWCRFWIVSSLNSPIRRKYDIGFIISYTYLVCIQIISTFIFVKRFSEHTWILWSERNSNVIEPRANQWNVVPTCTKWSWDNSQK